MSRLTRNGTAGPVSRDQILRREQRGRGNFHFPCSADHVQDGQGNLTRLIHTLAIWMAIHAEQLSRGIEQRAILLIPLLLLPPACHRRHYQESDARQVELEVGRDLHEKV